MAGGPRKISSFCCSRPIILIITLYAREKYRRVIATDGNFVADHCRIKNPEGDVPLTENEEGYMVEDKRYKEHIAISVEFDQV